MIKRFTKDNGQSYHNILELTWLFLLSELHEYLTFFGAYDIVNQVYNYRRLWWVVILTVSIMMTVSMFMATSSVYLLKTFGIF